MTRRFGIVRGGDFGSPVATNAAIFGFILGAIGPGFVFSAWFTGREGVPLGIASVIAGALAVLGIAGLAIAFGIDATARTPGGVTWRLVAVIDAWWIAGVLDTIIRATGGEAHAGFWMWAGIWCQLIAAAAGFALTLVVFAMRKRFPHVQPDFG